MVIIVVIALSVLTFSIFIRYDISLTNLGKQLLICVPCCHLSNFQPGIASQQCTTYTGSDSPPKMHVSDEMTTTNQTQVMGGRSQMTQSHSSGGLKSRLMNVLGLSPGNEGGAGGSQ